MNDKIKQAAPWMAKELHRTANMAMNEFWLESNDMGALYAEYARLRANNAK